MGLPAFGRHKETYTWSEVFQRLDLNGLQQALSRVADRGQDVTGTGAPMPAARWHGAAVAVETRK